jgi:excinuclease ABC subunit C
MVVFEDGLARKAEYRHFTVHGPNGEGAVDDTAAMDEVLTRRFSHLKETGSPSTAEGGSSSFAYRPNLVVVDGGLPQVHAAVRALKEVGITDVALVGLAKRLEEVWVPDEEFPVILPRNSEGLFLLQRVRDEAHRFAITHHRKKRSQSMTRSALDSVPGLGPAKQKALLKHFGSLKRIKEASPEELRGADGIGPSLADAIWAHLHGTIDQ